MPRARKGSQHYIHETRGPLRQHMSPDRSDPARREPENPNRAALLIILITYFPYPFFIFLSRKRYTTGALSLDYYVGLTSFHLQTRRTYSRANTTTQVTGFMLMRC